MNRKRIYVYQKMPKTDLEFWYGSEGEIGMKEKLERKEVDMKSRGEGRMMEISVMTEEDLMRIIKKQKSGKAAGVDGVRAEVMKQVIKNKSIRKSMTRAFNQSLDEMVNWR